VVAVEADEIHGLVSVIGQSLGFTHLPLPYGDRVPLLDVTAAANLVGDGSAVSAPAKLNLLQHAAEGAHITDRQSLLPIALSLVKVGVLERNTRAGELLDEIFDRASDDRSEGTHAEDHPSADASPAPDNVGEALRLPYTDEDMVFALHESSVTVTPHCAATTRIIDDRPALSLNVTVETSKPFAEVIAMADPLFWPTCPPQSWFFKRMDMVEPPRPPLPALQGIAGVSGWSARLREVVDFSYGFNLLGSSKMTTDLDFVHFATESATGCTYDLYRSERNRIIVDRGYVLIEDLQSRDRRRTTTLKQVYFRTRPQPGDVCRFWSLAQGLVSSSCMSKPHGLSGSTL
jgi:hypothetical protein